MGMQRVEASNRFNPEAIEAAEAKRRDLANRSRKLASPDSPATADLPDWQPRLPKRHFTQRWAEDWSNLSTAKQLAVAGAGSLILACLPGVVVLADYLVKHPTPIGR